MIHSSGSQLLSLNVFTSSSSLKFSNNVGVLDYQPSLAAARQSCGCAWSGSVERVQVETVENRLSPCAVVREQVALDVDGRVEPSVGWRYAKQRVGSAAQPLALLLVALWRPRNCFINEKHKKDNMRIRKQNVSSGKLEFLGTWESRRRLKRQNIEYSFML